MENPHSPGRRWRPRKNALRRLKPLNRLLKRGRTLDRKTSESESKSVSGADHRTESESKSASGADHRTEPTDSTISPANLDVSFESHKLSLDGAVPRVVSLLGVPGEVEVSFAQLDIDSIKAERHNAEDLSPAKVGVPGEVEVSFAQLDVNSIKAERHNVENLSPPKVIYRTSSTPVCPGRSNLWREEEEEGTEVILFDSGEDVSAPLNVFEDKTEKADEDVFLSLKPAGPDCDDDSGTKKPPRPSIESLVSPTNLAQSCRTPKPSPGNGNAAASVTPSDSFTWVSHDEDCEKSDTRPLKEISFPTPLDCLTIDSSDFFTPPRSRQSGHDAPNINAMNENIDVRAAALASFGEEEGEEEKQPSASSDCASDVTEVSDGEKESSSGSNHDVPTDEEKSVCADEVESQEHEKKVIPKLLQRSDQKKTPPKPLALERHQSTPSSSRQCQNCLSRNHSRSTDELDTALELRRRSVIDEILEQSILTIPESSMSKLSGDEGSTCDSAIESFDSEDESKHNTQSSEQALQRQKEQILSDNSLARWSSGAATPRSMEIAKTFGKNGNTFIACGGGIFDNADESETSSIRTDDQSWFSTGQNEGKEEHLFADLSNELAELAREGSGVMMNFLSRMKK